MAERNSEGKYSLIFGVVAMVFIALSGAISALMETPLVDQWPWLGTAAVIFASVAKVLSSYTDSRPGKTAVLKSTSADPPKS
jgi:hypothetical protein